MVADGCKNCVDFFLGRVLSAESGRCAFLPELQQERLGEARLAKKSCRRCGSRRSGTDSRRKRGSLDGVCVNEGSEQSVLVRQARADDVLVEFVHLSC